MSMPTAVFSATLLMPVSVAGNSGAWFIRAPFVIVGTSSTSVTVIVTMMEALAPKESSAMTVTM